VISTERLAAFLDKHLVGGSAPPGSMFVPTDAQTMGPYELTAPWTGPGAAPRCTGIRARAGQETGIRIGEAGPVVQRIAGEEVWQLARRAAALHGTAAPYVLLYAHEEV
jgi:hypothetical protein